MNVPQKHSKNIALERSRNPDIFLAPGTFLERSNGTFRTFREGIALWGLYFEYRCLDRSIDQFLLLSVLRPCMTYPIPTLPTHFLRSSHFHVNLDIELKL